MNIAKRVLLVDLSDRVEARTRDGQTLLATARPLPGGGDMWAIRRPKTRTQATGVHGKAAARAYLMSLGGVE